MSYQVVGGEQTKCQVKAFLLACGVDSENMAPYPHVVFTTLLHFETADKDFPAAVPEGTWVLVMVGNNLNETAETIETRIIRGLHKTPNVCNVTLIDLRNPELYKGVAQALFKPIPKKAEVVDKATTTGLGETKGIEA